MPIQQPWIDPNTGAAFPQTYVRVVDVRVAPQDRQATITVGRWVASQTYSGGQAPLRVQDYVLTGSAYDSALGVMQAAVQASYRAALMGIAASYVYGLLEFSGGLVVT